MEGGRAFRKPKTLKALETRKPGTDQAGESSLGIPIPRRLLCLASAPTILLPLSSHPPPPSQDSEQCSFRNRRLPRAFLPGVEPGHGNHWPCDDPFPRHGKAWAILPCCAEGSLADFVSSRQCPDTKADATRWANALAVLNNTDLATRYPVDGRSKPSWRRLKRASVRALITGARCVPMAITDAAQGIHQRMSPTSNLPFGAPRTSLPNFSAPAGPGNRPLSDRIGEIDMELDDVVRHLKLRHESQEKLESCTP